MISAILAFVDVNNELISLLAISESLSLPITGETEKVIDGIECLWSGNGWMPAWEYNKI